MRARLAVAAILLAGLAGCLGPSSRASVRSTSCEDIGIGACQEQVERLAALHPGAVSVDVRCGVPTCDRRGGAGTATVTMPDGTTIDETFQYVGKGPVPPAACDRLAPGLCQRLGAEAADEIPPSRGILGIRIRCTAASCTEAEGGSRSRSGSTTAARAPPAAAGRPWNDRRAVPAALVASRAHQPLMSAAGLHASRPRHAPPEHHTA